MADSRVFYWVKGQGGFLGKGSKVKTRKASRTTILDASFIFCHCEHSEAIWGLTEKKCQTHLHQSDRLLRYARNDNQSNHLTFKTTAPKGGTVKAIEYALPCQVISSAMITDLFILPLPQNSVSSVFKTSCQIPCIGTPIL